MFLKCSLARKRCAKVHKGTVKGAGSIISGMNPAVPCPPRWPWNSLLYVCFPVFLQKRTAQPEYSSWEHRCSLWCWQIPSRSDDDGLTGAQNARILGLLELTPWKHKDAKSCWIKLTLRLALSLGIMSLFIALQLCQLWGSDENSTYDLWNLRTFTISIYSVNILLLGSKILSNIIWYFFNWFLSK